ncbi:MAG: hypothetical protein JW952_04670 [Candidatus Eisenbacteria bacterium]|nr:hypothetical protein [Candidatus Eisenbacteria bacterium]
MKRLVIATLTFLLFGAPGLGRAQVNTERYLGAFETIWTKVSETFFDSSFGGVDWQDIHEAYKPQVGSAEDDAAFYSLVNKMLWELKVSHAALVPPGHFASVEPVVFAPGGIGVQVRMLDGAVVITAVDPESPGYEAGLRRGFIIQAIDSIPIARVEKEVKLDMPPYNDRGRVAQVTKGIMGRIYGTPETEVTIAYLDGGGQQQEKKITRAKRSGVALDPRGTLFMAVEFEAKRLDDGIGYIRLNTLQPQLVPQISGAVKSFGDISGLILDLRGNSGGEIEGMADLFLSEKTLLFHRKAREGKTEVFSEPSGDVYEGPLVVLIDVMSGSASELLAACLQASKRAVVVGERSPGSVTESDATVLPNGAVFLYPVAQPSTRDGTVLEGHGVIPDIEARLTRETLLQGVDFQLDAALKQLKEK